MTIVGDVTRLLARIEESGLNQRDFAEQVVLRDARTVRRWRDGSSPIPVVVRRWLRQAELTRPDAPGTNPSPSG